MFNDIKPVHSDHDFHRFFLRDSSGNIVECRMKRVTFGVKSSPFLATNVLLHHASTHRHSHPLAIRCIEECFYVNDLLSGTNTVEEAMALRESICNLFEEAGMTLRKWRTNSDSFRNSIPTHLVEWLIYLFPLLTTRPKRYVSIGTWFKTCYM